MKVEVVDPGAPARADFRRWQQAVRRQVRLHVKANREAPPLTMWASDGADPRRARVYRVGAAEDSLGVKAHIVGGIRECESSFAAVGRLLVGVDQGSGEQYATSVFGLTCFSGSALQGFSVETTAGRVAAWAKATVVPEVDVSEADAWYFVMQAIRTAETARVEAPAS